MFESITDVVPEKFNDICEFYENAFTRDKKPIFIRAGTPISNADPNDFPSPRVGTKDINNRNYNLVPNFNEDRNGNKIDYESYVPEGCKTLNMIYKAISARKGRRVHRNTNSSLITADVKVRYN
jgi:hypothetical protein